MLFSYIIQCDISDIIRLIYPSKLAEFNKYSYSQYSKDHIQSLKNSFDLQLPISSLHFLAESKMIIVTFPSQDCQSVAMLIWKFGVSYSNNKNNTCPKLFSHCACPPCGCLRWAGVS